MGIFEWAKTILDWFAIAVLVLIGLFFAILFVTCVPAVILKGNYRRNCIKTILLHILCIFIVFGFTTFIIWIGPLAPKKDLVVVSKEFPKLDGSEGTRPAYFIYYMWDGEQEELPWWVVFQRPFQDNTSEWAIAETADINNFSDINDIAERFWSADTFDGSWFDNGIRKVKRTRTWKFRLMIFGKDEKFEKEKNVIKQVLELIDKSERNIP